MTAADTLNAMGSQTLSQRLTGGRLPVGEALRYAMLLAEALRKLHDDGQVHGAVSPASVVLADSALELRPAERPNEITPYTAPEVVSGRPADAVSDIFSYGAVLYEMITGRPAFEGLTQPTLAANILDSQPASTGSPAVDRLLASCLAKDPTIRCQRMQKVILELKLLAVAARKAEAAAAPRRDSVEAKQEKTAETLAGLQSQVAAFAEQLAAAHQRAGRAEEQIQSLHDHIGSQVAPNLESFAGRFTQLEQSLGSVADRLGALEKAEAITALPGQVAAFGEQMAAAHERAGRAEQQIQSLHDRIGSEVGPNLESLSARLAQLEHELPGIAERLGNLEQGTASLAEQAGKANADVAERFTQWERTIGEVRDRMTHIGDEVSPLAARLQELETAFAAATRQAAEAQDRATADIVQLEAQLKDHAGAIESARAASAQTDDLVERVVEALESLQSTVLEQPEGGAAGGS